MRSYRFGKVFLVVAALLLFSSVSSYAAVPAGEPIKIGYLAILRRRLHLGAA